MDKQCAMFYVNSYRASHEIRKLSGSITTEQGTKMDLIVRTWDQPQVWLNELAKNAIKGRCK